MSEYLPVEVHNEYARRMEDEHKRLNHRIVELEKISAQNNKLLVSVERLAVNMEIMQKEQQGQGKRLEALESRDGDMWRTVVKYAITAVIGLLVGLIFSKIGF